MPKMTDLKPTNIPLTAKEFSQARCGVCFACGCYCGYIAYLKDGEIVDLYGHPYDPNGVGSFCTKGITYVQQLRNNPLRLKRVYKAKQGSEFVEATLQEVLDEIKNTPGESLGIFLDRSSSLEDYWAAKAITDNLYSDAQYLPFKAGTLKPQEWAQQKLILALEFEPEFSEVMSARWLVDAVERGAHLVSVSSRYSTVSSKAEHALTVNPYQVVKFLNDLALQAQRRPVISEFEDLINKLLVGFSTLKESLIIVGDSLLRTPFKDTLLYSLRTLVETFGINYSIVGNISPLPLKTLEDFIKEAESLRLLILTGNPFRYLSDEAIERLKEVKKVALTTFPNLTALRSDWILPVRQFYEREFTGFLNSFGYVLGSDKVLEFEGYSLEDILSFNKKATAFGGEDFNLPTITQVEIPESPLEEEEAELYLMVDRTLVEELGHWNPWTHAIERKQLAHMNRETAKVLGLSEGDTFIIRGLSLTVSINNNVAEGVILVPESFEEMQPFDPGIRVGRLMKKPWLRVEELRP